MQDVFWGIVLISIGVIMGGSIFLGDFDPASIIFDALGIFFIGKGLFNKMSAGADS